MNLSSINARHIANKIRTSIGLNSEAPTDVLPKEDVEFGEIWARCKPYTMTSFARGLAVFRAVRHIIENDIAGDCLECGVWRGGSSMIAMLAFISFGVSDRRFVLFDTFQGMTEPGQADVDMDGASAHGIWQAQTNTSEGWCKASKDEVLFNINSINYPPSLVTFVEGDIRETALAFKPGPIALLRLDTDFYDSTKTELECFYQHLQTGGVLIVDDYGHWQGARRAVDEYFATERRLGRSTPMLQLIDYTGRIATK